ncbi:hypothetical protein EIN_381780 [Entamoeba invadens IP1]|uniref:Uncharacterized protein n=1 Tax=Entamoeba invadens IP1 TaxID=370355 RepID=A0A0A1UEH8_ENTIV|nr:hypothetical protein EIN_381780 [Entamoeba invadens IP1]ELP92201.1 hypothetical protein EIN_381780 [Entamoeba invadens IP1]|eukprot:XP_004258972.1 hypothetical protein EIN_381780 [Entamoeba invadens IP1]
MRDPEARADFLTSVKMYFLSMPEMQKVLEGNYELVFNTKSMDELVIAFVTLVGRFYRNPNFSREDKFRLFQRIQMNPHEDAKRLMKGEVATEIADEVIQKVGEIQMMIRNTKAMQTNIYDNQQLESQMFEKVMQSINSADRKQMFPIDVLLEPLSFPNETQLNHLKSQFGKLVQSAGPDKMKLLAHKLMELGIKMDNENNEMSFDINDFNISQLNSLIVSLL